MTKITEELKQNLLHALSELSSKASMVKFAVKKRLNVLEPVNIMPFYGFASDNYVYLKGRVLEQEKLKDTADVEKLTEQWLNMWKRMESDEIPGAKLKAWFDGKELDIETDEEGYFDVEIHTDEKINFGNTGHKIQLQLQEQYTDHDKKDAEGYLFVPGKDIEFGVISDVDDTVLVSHVKEFMGTIRLMLQKNATERSPFPGIAAYLRALEKGSDGNGHNPIFFVSGSEWNLYDLLVSFLKSHNIPQGPLLLRDHGTTWDKGKNETSEAEYKREKIRHILDTYPAINFICIGDSGQQDPEVYEKIADEYPGRIIGIYIRDVTPDKSNKKVKEIANRLKQKGIEMMLAEETFSAAKHAVKMGWINEDQLTEIEQECKEDQQQE
ncbi:App1 family protein [Pontibacter sp. MBLB2868]|uniref:App1 family protein n=1 Tax=Pontibacter sp. MBLB2868 TaxID=3451555 RepID=UPI003F75046F